MLADSICRNCVNLHDTNHFYPSEIHVTSQPWQIYVQLIEKSFNISRDWFVFKINYCLWKKENKGSHAKLDFRFFFQSALIWPILTHFEKEIFFSKCDDLVPNLTHFKIFFTIIISNVKALRMNLRTTYPTSFLSSGPRWRIHKICLLVV